MKSKQFDEIDKAECMEDPLLLIACELLLTVANSPRAKLVSEATGLGA